MKATELMIGNWVKLFSCEDFIEEIGKEYIETTSFRKVSIKDVSGIPLTPEWVERFGFELNKDGVFVLNKFCIEDREAEENRFGSWMNNNYLMEVKFIHQLQNLYFAITGKELKKS